MTTVYVVIGHETRKTQATKLATDLDAELFLDDSGIGCLWNHLRALSWAYNKADHVTVAEDDAQPVKNFQQHVEEDIEDKPDALLSHYLGTSTISARNTHMDHQLRDVGDAKWFQDYSLHHAVCYSLPTSMIPRIFKNVQSGIWPPIEFISPEKVVAKAFRQTNKPILHRIKSLVEHEDGESIIGHARPGHRKARFLEGEIK